ncbi:acyl carrier protein [bacterium]|nr:acyl carrier protein [bacterium]
MERNEILEKVIKLAKEKLVPKKNIEVKETSCFQEDLNADSIDITDFVMELENEFDIKISDKDVENIKTVGDAVNLIYADKNKSK